MTLTSPPSSSSVHFRVTGSAAHGRLSPLVPPDWVDLSPPPSSAEPSAVAPRGKNNNGVPDFLWENAPRRETRPYRNQVSCYSHLPNGTEILDNKWVLARLFQDDDSTLETYCFRGISGLKSQRLSLWNKNSRVDCTTTHFYDLTKPSSTPTTHASSLPNLWVIKDAGSNGAGGVWVVGHKNIATFTNPKTSPLVEDHRYVAQRYAWPPVLYGGRKCHVRVYGLFTSDGRAFVHNRAFLHVANDPFTTEDGNQDLFTPSVHITNCCANSHDQRLFAGEICASLVDAAGNVPVVPLADFSDSIYTTLASLARRSFPFLQGGQANNGFEYLGLDFILSHRHGKPVAYLLEVNAPPSQDTATGLAHAEDLHDSVVADILSLWVMPKVLGVAEKSGGWQCVYQDDFSNRTNNIQSVLPCKAAILNKIRWAIFERKAARNDEGDAGSSRRDLSSVIRSFFPFYQQNQTNDSSVRIIFFENAGGSQVPIQVIDSVNASLRNRHRSVIGYQAKERARSTMFSLLGASPDLYSIYFGSNASTLLSLLAKQYAHSGFLKKGDEVIVSCENHLANVTPWLQVAQQVGATVIWWGHSTCPSSVEKLLSPRTRVVAVAHASNILGQVRDIRMLCQVVRRTTQAMAHVIVDGVAAVPHCFADLDDLQADWYAVSCHKVFGTHLGVLCGRRAIMSKLDPSGDVSSCLEMGTISYEACAGIEGLGSYFAQIAMLSYSNILNTGHAVSKSLDRINVKAAYVFIASIEEPLIKLLRKALASATKVRIIGDSRCERVERLPVFSFVHGDIPSSEIVDVCHKHGIVCRSGTFLSSSIFQQEYDVSSEDGVVRISLAHYNTADEVQRLIRVLEAIPGW